MCYVAGKTFPLNFSFMLLARFAVKQESYYAKWSKFQNTQQNFTKFSGMLGEHEKSIREKFC